MVIKYRCNLASGIAAILFSIVLFILIPQQIAVETVVNFGVTSRTIPYGIAVLFAVCGVGLIFQSLVLKKDKEMELNLHAELRPFLLFALFIVYIFVFEKEWPISTAALACGGLALSKCKKWQYYVIVIVLTLAMYFLFVNVLHIRLQSVIL